MGFFSRKACGIAPGGANDLPPLHEASESEDPTSDEARVGHGIGKYCGNFKRNDHVFGQLTSIFPLMLTNVDPLYAINSNQCLSILFPSNKTLESRSGGKR